MNSFSEPTDLVWLAFSYVHGELAAEEVANFEQRLEHDQDAREAVAEAVELVHAIRSMPCDVVSPPARQVVLASQWRSQWMQATGWSAVGAAACLAVVAVAHFSRFESRGPEVVQRPAEIAADEAQLALVWSELQQEQAADGESSEAFAITDNLAAADGDESVEDDLAAPSWLLAAVAGDEVGSADRTEVGQ